MRGIKRRLDSNVQFTDNGEFIVEGELKSVIDQETIAILSAAKVKFNNIHLRNGGRHNYPVYEIYPLHVIVGRATLDHDHAVFTEINRC